MSTLIMHIGAHKTATTSIQQILKWNTRHLQAVGIQYIVKPGRVKFYISGERPCTLEDARAILRGNPDRPDDVIIFSDEDCLRPATIAHPCNIYADFAGVVQRIARLGENGQNMNVLFAIRDYAGFIPSVYQQEVKRGRIGLTFDDYLAERVDMKRISWMPAVRMLAETFGDRLTVWDYRLLKDNPERLWSAFGISAEVQAGFNYPKGASNRSLSALGLELMRKVHGQVPPETVRELEMFVARHLRVSPDLPSEPNFSADIAKKISEKYVSDVQDITSILHAHGAQFAA